jgi:hypothetical protein
MSRVTDVILTCGCSEEVGPEDGNPTYRVPAVEPINEWLLKNNYGKLVRVDEYVTSGKAMQATVFIGAFNYLDLKEFIKVVDAAPWDVKENTALFVKEEEQDTFRQVVLDQGSQCLHLDTVVQYTGDGTPVEFCPECGKNVFVGSGDYLPVPEDEGFGISDFTVEFHGLPTMPTAALKEGWFHIEAKRSGEVTTVTGSVECIDGVEFLVSNHYRDGRLEQRTLTRADLVKG